MLPRGTEVDAFGTPVPSSLAIPDIPQVRVGEGWEKFLKGLLITGLSNPYGFLIMDLYIMVIKSKVRDC